MVIGGSGWGKTNTLFNLIKEQDIDNLIDKIYLYAKDLNEPKYQLLIKKRENVGVKHLSDPRAFIEYSNTMDDVCNNIDDYNPKRNKKILIVLDDMITLITPIKNFKPLSKNYLLDAENVIYLLHLLHNLIFLFQKKSD